MLNAATVAYGILPQGGWRVLVMALEDGGRESPEILASLSGRCPPDFTFRMAERYARVQAESLAVQRGIPREHVIRADPEVAGAPDAEDEEPATACGI